MLKKLVVNSLSAFLFSITIAHAKQIDVEVSGLVCEFCAVTIERSFTKKADEVDNVVVDLDAGKVIVNLKDGQDLSDEVIKDVIVNNGYNVVKINR